MRAPTVAALAVALLLPFTACVPNRQSDKQPEWMKLPEAYQPKTAALTFNEDNLKNFNILNSDDQQAFIEDLKGKKGAFKGMAVFQTGAGLGEAMANSKYGTYELSAATEEVFLEITLDYTIFTTREVGKPLPPNGAIEFTGTLVEVNFQNQDKPRKLSLKVQADSVTPIKR